MAAATRWRQLAATTALLVAGAAIAMALPTDNLQIESKVMEVRAAPVQMLDLEAAATGGNRHHHHHGGHGHGGEGGGHHGTVGYLRTKDSKGDHGYQKFDSFHKKNGDAYGFETHSAFGKAKKHGDHGDHEGAGTEDVEHFGGGGDGGHYSEHYTSGGGGDGGHYSGGEGGDGEGGHYSEHYSSGSDGDGDGGYHGYEGHDD